MLLLPVHTDCRTDVKDVQENQVMVQGAYLCGASQSPELLLASV